MTAKGWFLVVIFLFTISLSVLQEVDDQADRRETTHRNEIELQRREREANNRQQQSTREIIEALALYGLKYDTAQKRVEKLMRDSSRTMIIKGAEPLLKFCASAPAKIPDGDSCCAVTVRICNEGAVSRNISLRVFFFLADNNKYAPYESLQYINVYTGLLTPFSLGAPEWRNFTIPFNSSIRDKHLLILLNGQYTNTDGSKTFTADDVIMFSFDTNEHLFPTDRGQRLKDFLRQSGVQLF